MMKKILWILILFSFFLSCKTLITESERQEIIAELDAIRTIDQKYAGIPPKEQIEKYGQHEAWLIFKRTRDSLHKINQDKIKELYNKYGYLGYKEVGKKASGDFWISIQHADNDVEFQQKMLKALKKEIAKNNASRAEYALLEDRVNVNLGKKQRFGTQLTYNEFGQAIPRNGLIDSVHIEQLRKEYNLPTIREYYNHMTTKHFNMNKAFYETRGITEPRLYK